MKEGHMDMIDTTVPAAVLAILLSVADTVLAQRKRRKNSRRLAHEVHQWREARGQIHLGGHAAINPWLASAQGEPRIHQ